MKRFFLLLLIPLLCIGCGDDGGNEPTPPEPPTPPTDAPAVLLSRENPIRFSAAATESYTVTVTSTLDWTAVADKTWCKVTTEKGRFIVRADANTQDSEPEQAVVTVAAGGVTYATLAVTQEAAVVAYPATIEKFNEAILKTWTSESGPYESLTFLPLSRFVLVPRAKVRSEAPEGEVLSGTYVVSLDLRTVKLQDHAFAPVGTLVFSDLSSESAAVDFTPANGSVSHLSLKSSPATEDRAPHRRLKHLRAEIPDEGIFEYDFTWSHGRLVAAKGGLEDAGKVNYALSYPAANQLVITSSGTVEGERFALTADFMLDGQGRAIRMEVKETSGDYIGAVSLAYRGDGRLGFYEAVDGQGRFYAQCQTQWNGGDLMTEYVKYRFPWDEDGNGWPDYDFNGDEVIDANDRILFSWDTTSYTYSQKENVANLMLPFEVFEVFAFDDMGDGFGYIAYLAGVMGPGTKHLLSAAGRRFNYEFDSENYPTKVSVVEPEYPEDNFSCTLEFAWPE